ncbi:MAG: PEP-CTERM sorting domain-containing protein [Chthoniobacter sp.]|nr:PEP-CTERM sorting domain-containing protein [Chthoniobacter sp.]
MTPGGIFVHSGGTPGSGLGFYFFENGFYYGFGSTDVFVPVADMTSFHTYGSHIYNGVASVCLDGALLASGTASSGPASFMVLGDGSAGSVSGYGNFLVDNLDITVSAGPATASAPEPSTVSLIGLALVGGATRRFREAGGRQEPI